VSVLSDVAPVSAVLKRPHGLLEGPRFGPGGVLVYSDVIAGGVFECAPDGAPRELLPKRRGIGGIVPHADGGWVLSGRDLLHLAASGEQRLLYADAEASGFNDLGTTGSGDLLAGLLRYRPLAGERERNGALLRVTRGGVVEAITEEIIWPNGIGVAADGRTIFVSDYATGSVLAVSTDDHDVHEFCRSPRGSADGLALDCEGGVWFALGEGGGVARFSANGQLDELIELPASFVSSLCFGGLDMRDVLISTADNRVEPERGGTLLRARSEVAGLPVSPATV
jgi:sugar lactone lactonase YvrE